MCLGMALEGCFSCVSWSGLQVDVGKPTTVVYFFGSLVYWFPHPFWRMGRIFTLLENCWRRRILFRFFPEYFNELLKSKSISFFCLSYKIKSIFMKSAYGRREGCHSLNLACFSCCNKWMYWTFISWMTKEQFILKAI